MSNFTRLTARKITYNNFEISLVLFMPDINTNHAITYSNWLKIIYFVVDYCNFFKLYIELKENIIFDKELFC